jgi:hypothetical protein
MFRKTLSILITLLFSFSVLASPSSGVKEVFDEYVYAMEVEGGAFDSFVRRNAEEKLSTEIEALLRSGVTRSEILKESFKLVKNESTRKELLALLAQLDNGSLSENQFRTQLHQSINASYAQGANWTEAAKIVVGSAFVIFIVWMLFDAVTKCLGNDAEETPGCQDYTDKYGPGKPWYEG